MADAILGLQDSSAFAEFENWRRAILLAFPNGSAPLTAILNLMKSESSDHPKINWDEKDMPLQRSTLSASYTNVATTIAVDEAVFRPGHIIKNLTTTNGEVMKVESVSANGLTLTVRRSDGTGTDWPVAAEASSGSNDTIAIIGNSNSEGSGAPKSQSYDPTEYFNYLQIFKSTADVTGTAAKTAVKWDQSGPWPEKLREALNFISIEMEKAFIWGSKAQWTNSTTGKKERTTGGIVSFINSANVINLATSLSSTLTYALWDTYMEQVFRKCLNNRQEKFALCGSGFARVLNRVCQNNATMNLVPKAESFGMKIYEMTSTQGTVYLKTHPLFSQNDIWRNHCLILDLPGLRYRYLNGRDLTRIPDVQLPDEDIKKDMFIAECGLEVNHGGDNGGGSTGAHLLIQNATTAGT